MVGVVQIVVTEQRKAFYHFITTLCAIVGGVFTVAGIVDGLLHQSVNLAKKVRRSTSNAMTAHPVCMQTVAVVCGRHSTVLCG